MVRKLLVVLGLALTVTGCTTMQKEQPMVTQLQFRVGELERVVQTKDQRISELEYEIKDLTYDVKQLKDKNVSSRSTSYKTNSVSKNSSGADDRIIRVEADPKDVQQALKSAGYYTGEIDGNVGSGTKKAIYQFQKDNDLTADGLIGQQTWNKLKAFL